jgi:hypothetical protein
VTKFQLIQRSTGEWTLPPDISQVIATAVAHGYPVDVREFDSGTRTGVVRLATPDDVEDWTMVSLRSLKTGVANTLWVSGRRGNHGARLKVAIDPPDAFVDDGETVLVTIPLRPEQQPEVIGGTLREPLWSQVRAFIDLNRPALLDHWNGVIDGTGFVERMRPIDRR